MDEQYSKHYFSVLWMNETPLQNLYYYRFIIKLQYFTKNSENKKILDKNELIINNKILSLIQLLLLTNTRENILFIFKTELTIDR